MIFPQIHWNGTGPKTLIEAYSRAYDAIGEAMDALAQCAPNMRDYYVHPDGPQAFEQAIAEHMRRMDALRGVRDELEQLINHVDSEAERLGMRRY